MNDLFAIGAELEQFRTSHPSVSYYEKDEYFTGIVDSLTLIEKILVIDFKWLIVGGRLINGYNARFENLTLVNTGDILVIQYGDNNTNRLHITNLIGHKFPTLKAVEQLKKE